MAGLGSGSFDYPRRGADAGQDKVDVVRLGSATAARMTMQPGWRWSECIKPVAGTDSCQARHVGVVVQGGLHLVHDDGSEADLATGDTYVIEPGHDAWVTSQDAFIGYEFESRSAETYATPS